MNHMTLNCQNASRCCNPPQCQRATPAKIAVFSTLFFLELSSMLAGAGIYIWKDREIGTCIMAGTAVIIAFTAIAAWSVFAPKTPGPC